MTDKCRRLAELRAQHRELVKKRDRLDLVSDADMVSGYGLHRLLKAIASLESQIDDLHFELYGQRVIDKGVINFGLTDVAPIHRTPIGGGTTNSL